MKTIQECLRECDREKIINMYLKTYSFSVYMEYDEDGLSIMSWEEWEQQCRRRINDLIDKIISVEPKAGDDKWILITTHATPEYLYTFHDIMRRQVNDGITHRLVNESELLTMPLEQIADYEFGASTFETIASFYVADTYLTQYFLDDLLVFFLFEAASYGFKKEHLDNPRPIHEQIIDGNYPGKYDPYYEPLDDHMPDNEDPRQWGVYYRYVDASAEADKKYRSIEYWMLKELILSARGMESAKIF